MRLEKEEEKSLADFQSGSTDFHPRAVFLEANVSLPDEGGDRLRAGGLPGGVDE